MFCGDDKFDIIKTYKRKKWGKKPLHWEFSPPMFAFFFRFFWIILNWVWCQLLFCMITAEWVPQSWNEQPFSVLACLSTHRQTLKCSASTQNGSREGRLKGGGIGLMLVRGNFMAIHPSNESCHFIYKKEEIFSPCWTDLLTHFIVQWGKKNSLKFNACSRYSQYIFIVFYAWEFHTSLSYGACGDGAAWPLLIAHRRGLV